MFYSEVWCFIRMWSTICLFLATLWILRRFFMPKKSRGDLDKIPCPIRSGFFSGLFIQQVDLLGRHALLANLSKKCGPIFRISTSSTETIVISDYDSMHQILIGAAKDFGGRADFLRLREITQKTGILFSRHPDATWKGLRKATQRHLRQFGDGLSRLESIISEVAEDMFNEFSNQVGKPFDPKSVIFDTALNSIAFLICGERTHSGDPIVEKMREYEGLFTKCTASAGPLKVRILDYFPFLKYLGAPGWKMIQRIKQLEKEVWQLVNDMNKENPESHSLCRVLNDNICTDKEGPLTVMDARQTSLQLLFAGVITTSNTFYGGINLLAHHPEVQEKLFEEIKNITGGNRDVTLPDRPKMPYARAIVLEFLRYISVVPFGVGHVTENSTKLKDYNLPPGVHISYNQYAMHHNEEIWGDPFTFRPERFLDEEGDLVPADHPNRRHLLPFGAGLRVCLGESLALTRLFLWSTSLVQRFLVRPADDNDKVTTDSRYFAFEGVLRPTPYKIVFIKRQ